MCWLELEVRYGCMVLINILKTVVMDDDESWDTYGVMSSWNKFMLLSIVFFLLSFYSIQISFSTPLNIEVRYQNFNAIVFLSLFFSIILPQRACWPFLLLLWLSSYSALMKAVVCCFEAILCKIPGYNIHISTVQVESSADLEAAANELARE